MPELPEVEVVRRGLEEHVVGREIVSAELYGARVARRHVPGPADLAARVTGARVEAADRRGKYLWLALADPRGEAAGSPTDTSPAAGSPAVGSGGGALVVHLGMSGQLLVQPEGAPDERHLHARLRFADGGPELRFVDQRTFGGMSLADLVPDPAPGSSHGPGIPAPIVHIAPDPLEPAYDRDAVVARARLRHSEVKRVLLDQGLVSGIGNIYADEALWRARLHGARVAASLTRPVLRRVLDAAAEVMTEALGEGGTSFDALYVNVNGASGYFDRSLHAYGQEGLPCDRCSTPIRREAFANRSSFSCPVCQPRPRSGPSPRPALRVGGAAVPRTGPSR